MRLFLVKDLYEFNVELKGYQQLEVYGLKVHRHRITSKTQRLDTESRIMNLQR